MIGVVVVEDETYIRKGMVMTTPWKEFGCKVIGEAGDGQEGAELISKLKPDLVITDVNMPVVDGIQMIKNLKNLEDIEFIIISGYNDFAYAQQAIKLGVKDYLLKPIDDEDFESTLKKVVKVIKDKKEAKKNKVKSELIEQGKKELAFEKNYDTNYDARKKYVIRAMSWIEQHYMDNISIGDAVLELEISESYLSRLFKNYTGYTFVEYLTNYRIKMAIELLKDHRMKIYEVAEKVGYNDPKYFGILFKKKMGVTPMAFKNKLLSNMD